MKYSYLETRSRHANKSFILKSYLPTSIISSSTLLLLADNGNFNPDFSRQVCQDVLKSGYDADHFTIAVSLPVSLTLRSHSLNLYLEEKVSDFDVDRVVPIKQVKQEKSLKFWS